LFTSTDEERRHLVKMIGLREYTKNANINLPKTEKIPKSCHCMWPCIQKNSYSS